MKNIVKSAVRRSAMFFGFIARGYFAGYYYYAYFMPLNRTAEIF